MTRVVDRLRDPEYTGDRRCRKCTVLNLFLALLVAGLVAGIDAGAGVVVLALALVTIYLRGYLIPGTPQFTRRHLPDGVRAWFGTTTGPRNADPSSVESVLLAAGAVRPGDDDPTLDPEFRRHWRARIAEYRGDGAFVEMLLTVGGLDGVDPAEVTVAPRGDAFVAEIDGVRFAQWESRGAFLADVAAAREMEQRYADWGRLPFGERAAVLGGLRLWLDWCPLCEGRVTLGRDTVASCCRTVDVVAGTCEGCGRRMFEVDAPVGSESVERWETA